MQFRTFNPLTISRRKRLSTTLDLTFDKFVYYDRNRDLEQPRCTVYILKGGGKVTSGPYVTF